MDITHDMIELIREQAAIVQDAMVNGTFSVSADGSDLEKRYAALKAVAMAAFWAAGGYNFDEGKVFESLEHYIRTEDGEVLPPLTW